MTSAIEEVAGCMQRAKISTSTHGFSPSSNNHVSTRLGWLILPDISPSHSRVAMRNEVQVLSISDCRFECVYRVYREPPKGYRAAKGWMSDEQVGEPEDG